MKIFIILTALVVSTVVAATAQNKMLLLPQNEKQISTGSFEQLIVNGNFKLVLIENDQPSIYVKGNPRFVKSFKFNQRNKTLTISSNYLKNAADNNQVFIYVKKLKTLTVQQESVINSVGMLFSENSYIQLNAQCVITINNNDVTKIKASENFDIEILR